MEETNEGSAPDTSNETAAAETVAPVTSDVASTAAANKGTAPEQVGQDPSVVKYQALEKNYNELRRKMNEQGTERNQYKRQMESLQQQQAQILETLQKATQRPYNPDEFMESLRTQGPEFLKEHINAPITELKAAHEAYRAEIEDKYRSLEVRHEIQDRKINTDKYPDFSKLESEMTKAFNEGGLPFDTGPEVPVGQLLDSLYNYVKLQHSQDAFKAAEHIGRQKEKAELTREAQTGVAGGGKSAGTSVVNPGSFKNAAEMRKFFVDQIGETRD